MSLEENEPQKAKLFWNGRSQALRLPKEFRFDGDEVLIRREGDRVVLEPVPRNAWPTGYWRWVGAHRAQLDLGDVEPLKVQFVDPSEDDVE